MNKLSAEQREKIAASLRGRKRPPRSKEWGINLGNANRGKKISFRQREKISAALKGHGTSLETRQKIGDALRGRKHTPEQNAVTSAALKGRKISMESRRKLSATTLKHPDRRGYRGYDWPAAKRTVLTRDGCCQRCGSLGPRLAVHHVVPYLLTRDNSLENLITLCPACHAKVEWKLKAETQRQDLRRVWMYGSYDGHVATGRAAS